MDLSFVNPQALSTRSWILRAPLVRRLARHVAWWNAFWVEDFELVTAERPESCRALLDRAFPAWLNTDFRSMSGYVWRGGFTIFRITPWRNTMRAIGTGTFSSRAGLTHVAFRVGMNRYGAYGLLWVVLFFSVPGIFMLWAAATGRFPIYLAVIAAVLIALPIALFVAGGRTPTRDRKRSEEAVRLLAAVSDIIGAQELPRA